MPGGFRAVVACGHEARCACVGSPAAAPAQLPAGSCSTRRAAPVIWPHHGRMSAPMRLAGCSTSPLTRGQPHPQHPVPLQPHQLQHTPCQRQLLHQSVRLASIRLRGSTIRACSACSSSAGSSSAGSWRGLLILILLQGCIAACRLLPLPLPLPSRRIWILAAPGLHCHSRHPCMCAAGGAEDPGLHAAPAGCCRACRAMHLPPPARCISARGQHLEG